MKNITLPSGKEWFITKEFSVGKSPIAAVFDPFVLFETHASLENPHMKKHIRVLIKELEVTKKSQDPSLSIKIERERDALTYALFKKIEGYSPEAHLAFMLEVPKVIPTRYGRVFRKLIIKYPYEGIHWGTLKHECIKDGHGIEEAAIIERMKSTETETVTYTTTTDLSKLNETDKEFIMNTLPRVA